MLPGYTAYLLDFLYAANCIISSSELKGLIHLQKKKTVFHFFVSMPLMFLNQWVSELQNMFKYFVERLGLPNFV